MFLKKIIMRKNFTLLLLLSIISFVAKANELNYVWKANTSYAFNANVVDNISTSMMGMNVQEKYTTTTDFVLYVQTVSASGEAIGTLYLTTFKVVDSKGKLVASIANVPVNRIKSEVKVDRKGKFTFLKKVTLLTTATGNVLVYGSATENSAQVGGQVGNVKVDAYAEFDPKTGTLKANYKVQEIKTTKKVEVKLNENTKEIDVFPYDFLEFLVMPEGNVVAGDKAKVKAGMYQVDILVNSMTNGIATIDNTISTDKNSDMFGGGADVQTSEGGMQMGMGGFEQMPELTVEDQMAIGSAKAMSPEMSGKITANFDYTNGMFQQVKGKLITNINLMGVTMTVNSVLEMKKK
jgi:hypothetical protein